MKKTLAEAMAVQAEKGDVNAIRHLIHEHGADPKKQTNLSKKEMAYPLYITCKCGNLEAAKELLIHGVDPNTEGFYRKNGEHGRRFHEYRRVHAIEIAADYNLPSVVDLLFEYNAIPTAGRRKFIDDGTLKNKLGPHKYQESLMYAMVHGDFQHVKLLLRAGFSGDDWMKKDEDSVWYPIKLAKKCGTPQQRECFRLIVDPISMEKKDTWFGKELVSMVKKEQFKKKDMMNLLLDTMSKEGISKLSEALSARTISLQHVYELIGRT
jgi:hypothetical protein